MQIKIHINNKSLFLCDRLDKSLQELLHHPETIFIDELNTHSVKSMLKELELPLIQTGIFLHPDFDALKKAVFKKFELIKAGGGLVKNETNEILMIFRRGFWDLPKGKLDEGETIEECALREVQEETGLHNAVLETPLLITYHTYELGTHHILKESHWYTMRAATSETLIPQTEEDIERIQWVAQHELPGFINKAYPSIADVIHTWLKKQK